MTAQADRCTLLLQVLHAELLLNTTRVEEVGALAQELMSTRGDNCQAQVGPRVEQLQHRFTAVSQRITAAPVRQCDHVGGGGSHATRVSLVSVDMHADGSLGPGAAAVPPRRPSVAATAGGGGQPGRKPEGGGLPGRQGLTLTQLQGEGSKCTG